MTDNEIIKALECCVKTESIGDCMTLKCPLMGDYGCEISAEKEKLYEYALDLINRQKATIDSMEKQLNEKNEELDRMATALADERLQNEALMSRILETNDKIIRKG